MAESKYGPGVRVVPRSRLPRQIASLYSGYAFDPVDKRAGFYYSSGSAWQEVTERVFGYAWDQIVRARNGGKLSPELAKTELEFAARATVCWRDKGLGSLVTTEPRDVSGAEQAPAISSELAAIGAKLRDVLSRIPEEDVAKALGGTVIPVASGKGSPNWLSSTNRQSAIWYAALLNGVRTGEELVDRLQGVNTYGLPLCVTSYLRVQDALKPQPRMVLDQTELVLSGTRRGPKIRRVQALPFGLNYLSARAAELLRLCYITVWPSADGRLSTAQDELRGKGKLYALDLSKYDETIGAATLLAYRELVYAPWLEACVSKGYLSETEASLCLYVDSMIPTLPLLSPPGNRDDGALLLHNRGGLPSGERQTSLKGGIINKARLAAKLKHFGIEATAVNFGDDTIIATNADMSAYLAADDWAGFNETKADDPGFLMRHLPEGFAYLGRMLITTVNKEPRFEPRSSAIAILGAKSRIELLKGHPLAHVYEESVSRGNPKMATVISAAQRLTLQEALDAVVGDAVALSGASGSVIEDVERLWRAGLVSREYKDKVTALLGPDDMSGEFVRFDTLKQYGEAMSLDDARRAIINASLP